jgi:hypothetical protein
MDTGYLTVVAALGGACPGRVHFFCHFVDDVARPNEAQGNASSKSRRRKLYKSFIVVASKAYANALMTEQPEISGLIDLHALVSLMRVNSSAAVVRKRRQRCPYHYGNLCPAQQKSGGN